MGQEAGSALWMNAPGGKNPCQNCPMIDSLRADLAGWTRATIAQHLGERALAALDRDVAVPASLACADGGQIHQLTRLFWLGEGLGIKELQVALPTVFRDGEMPPEVAAYLVSRADSWFCRWQIVPVDVPSHLTTAAGGHIDADTVWIASSPGALQGARHAEHFVMGVGGATRTLAALAAYKPGQTVLDLGTGSGIHAILAALSGARVVATDISESALEMAHFNAEINGVGGAIDFRIGSLFEPTPERFDVVVSNPPFVITPAAARQRVGRLDYRDAGLVSDQLSAQVVRALAEHLTDTGRAWMLTNWEIADTAQPYAPVKTWAGTTLDLHLVMREQLPVTAYIEMWLRDGGLTPAHPDYADSYRVWLEDFDARGVTHIGMGYLAAGRGDGVVLAQELRGIAPANLHAYMERIWGGLRLTELAQMAPVATDVVEHRFFYPGADEPWIIKFTQTNGFGEEVQADTALAGFMSVADGELTTAQIVCALAELLSEDEDMLMDNLIPKVALLKQLGMLTFVEPVRE